MGLMDRLLGRSKNDDDFQSNISDDADPLVFISYSSYDKKIADNVCGFLESRNIKCFIPPRDVKRGADVIDQFLDAYKKVELVLLIFSRHSNESSRVNDQINAAFNQFKTILLFDID
jgi:hypothetical protein